MGRRQENRQSQLSLKLALATAVITLATAIIKLATTLIEWLDG